MNRCCPYAVKESRSERVGLYRNEQGGCACPDNYIIIDDTDSEPSEDDFVDEAGADIMESSTD